ncbi:hypothetical protein-transmembrane prediction [Rhodopirellula baltica SH 1]|uniref:Uncharacterized protein n=1 Tax=Rhodopirellula baltica (strain DSM 10527 / NCIMB 13988 / SH1) TaxID=243090 RepID=Q7ULP0_RHOBA|nr:hypothetical protein-transmembrane prediction [Rhodopirellula baltica SH 1]
MPEIGIRLHSSRWRLITLANVRTRELNDEERGCPGHKTIEGTIGNAGRFYASSKSRDQLLFASGVTHNCQKPTNPNVNLRDFAQSERRMVMIVPVFWVKGAFCVVWRGADIYSEGNYLVP